MTMNKLLIVDDDTGMCETLSEIFKENGYSITIVRTGKEAISKVKQIPFNVALIDIKLPDMDGTALLKEFKRMYAEMGCIIITGNASLQNAVIALKEGAIGYFVKPLVIEDVILRVEEAFDKQRLQRELRESEERYRGMVETSTEAIVSINEEGVIIQWNKAASRIFGYIKNEVMGKPIDILVTEEYKCSIIKGLKRFIENGEYKLIGEETEVEGLRKDGTVINVELSLSALKTEETLVFTAIMRDTTKRKLAERALKESEERFQQLFDEAPVGYHELDKEGRIVKVNRTELDMLGYTEEDMIGRHVWDFIVERDTSREAFKVKLEGAMKTGEAFERTYIKKDGTTLPGIIVDRLLKDKEGRIAGIRSTIQDISERKKLEEQIRQSQKMEAIGRLAGGLAHDFNNMMTAVIGYSELLLNRLAKNNPLRQEIEEIKKAGERATSLTNQLLAFSRRQVIKPEVLSLNALIANMERMLRPLIGEDIDLVIVLDPGLGPVKADPGQIEQIIMNLVVNARDAMPEGGKLIIETANVELDSTYALRHLAVQPGPYVMLAVSDTGRGMDKETQSHLFEPFFTTKGPGKGTGLGLSTIYGIVKQNSGNIWVYSEPGKGTTFKVYLLRAEEAVESIKKGKGAVKIPRGSDTILLVEDEDMVCDLACRVLLESGYSVLVAHNPGDAIKICERHGGPIHLMVSDVVMPNMNGRDLAKKLASIRPEMKVLYISGYADSTIIQHGDLESGVAFLQKPFTQSALTQKVRKVLDGEMNYKTENPS